MAERSGKLKKVMIIIVVTDLVLIAAGAVLWIRKQNELPKDLNGDGRLRDYFVQAEDCKRLYDNHKESFACLVETAKKQSTELFFLSGFDNKGRFYVKGELKYGEDFIEAMNDIYKDEMFRSNPNCYMDIDWNEDCGWYIDFRLFSTTVSYGGMKYHENPKESLHPYTEAELDNHWYWYWYGVY